MNNGTRVNVRIGELRLTDPRAAHEIEVALEAAIRGHVNATTGPAAAAVVARILTALDNPTGMNDEQ